MSPNVLSDRLFEKCLYAAIILSNTVYAVVLCLGFITIKILYRDYAKSRRWRAFYITYITTILMVQTVFVATLTSIGWIMWFEHRDYPQGPVAWYWQARGWIHIFTLALTKATTSLAIGLSHSIEEFTILTVTTITILIKSAGSSTVNHTLTNFTLLDVVSSTGVDLLTTALISIPLLRARKRLRKLNMPVPKLYASLVALFVDSSLPLGVFGVIFAVLSTLDIMVYEVFAVISALYAGVAPLLILYRIAKRTGWSRDDIETAISANIEFALRTSEERAT
ncbi:hypothetical protein VNI00_017493 [Paramarasmius palmivorus]|uniref:Uncharacterized protein n=1 Tax=Paramarasmius palmivorus TaxID=297713 RepID=A0AAW0B6K5_9AGAR